MNHRKQLVGCLLGAMAIAFASCSQSNPPAVAVAPAEVPAVKDQPTVQEQPPPVVKSSSGPDGGSFTFPEDSEGKALANALIPPMPRTMPVAMPVTPKPRRLPAFLEAPAPPSNDPAGALPRLGLPELKPAGPRPLPDSVPPDIGGAIPQLPARGPIATGPLTRHEERIINALTELPPLSARPIADRAPFDRSDHRIYRSKRNQPKSAIANRADRLHSH